MAYPGSLRRLRAAARAALVVMFVALAWGAPARPLAEPDAAGGAPTAAQATAPRDAGDPVKDREDARRIFGRGEFNRQRVIDDYEPLEYEEFAAERSLDRGPRGRAADRMAAWDDIQARMSVPATLPAKSGRAARANQIFGSRWIELGPRRVDNGQPTYPFGLPRLQVSGRTSCLAVDPTDPDTLYVGGAQGGVWKTEDGGLTWRPLTDREASLAMGSIDIHDANPQIIWVGTGEMHFSGDSWYGAGLLLSTDGGETWTNRRGPGNNLVGTTIARVAVDRTVADGSRVFVAASNGLRESVDGFATDSTTRGTGTWSDIQQDPNDPMIWHGGKLADGVYRSIDGGLTFAKVATAPTTTYSTGRVHLALHAGTGPDTTLYAVVVHSSSEISVHRSTDSGATWAPVSADPLEYNLGSQYWYDIYIAVSPANPDHLALGGVRCFVSSDGGASFSDAAANRNIHDDHHFGLFVDNGEEVFLYDMNDGGVFRSADLGATWAGMNHTLGLLQIQTITLHPTDEQVMLVGTQDNGTNMFNGTSVWTHVRGGDGGYTVFDPTDGQRAYGQYIRGYLYRTANGGFDNTWEFAAFGVNGYDGSNENVLGSGSEFAFYAPLEINPSLPESLILLGRTPWRTIDGATTWEGTSQLTTSQGSAIAFAPSSPETVYIGFNNGRIYRSTNVNALLAADVAWTRIDSGTPTSRVADLFVDPNDPAHLIACYARSDGQRVWESTNALDATPVFANRTTNLPASLPCQSIVLDPADPATWYVGTDFGVFRTLDAGASWENYATGLPMCVVYDLEIDPARNLLVAATHGRGAWRVAKPTIEVGDVMIDDTAAGDGDGAIDAGERFTLTVALRNVGEEDAVAAEATVSTATAGVTIHSASSDYGTVAAEGNATNASAFDVEVADLAEGTPVVLDLAFTSNGGQFARVLSVTLRVGPPTSSTLLAEDFEEDDGGFTVITTRGTVSWGRDGTKPHAGAFAFHAADHTATGLTDLMAPEVQIPIAQTTIELSFWHTWYLEGDNFDAGAVEVKRDDGEFVDILDPAAGVLGVDNGYNGLIQSGGLLGDNRLGYVNGASGQSFRRTSVWLDPAEWGGRRLTVRWRMAADVAHAPPEPNGWWIDDVAIVARSWFSPPAIAASGLGVY